MKNALIYAIVPASILGASIIISTLIYCESTRYECHQFGENGRFIRVFDRSDGVIIPKKR